MTDAVIFGWGLVASLLCTAFVALSFLELRRLGREAEGREPGEMR